MEIIGVIVAGIIIGLLGKFVAPGNRDNIPIWLTIICGIGGVLIGWFIYTAFGGNGSPGIDWVRWLIAIAVAVVLVMIASGLTARSRTPRALSVRTPSYPRHGIRVGGSCVSTMISPCSRSVGGRASAEPSRIPGSTADSPLVEFLQPSMCDLAAGGERQCDLGNGSVPGSCTPQCDRP